MTSPNNKPEASAGFGLVPLDCPTCGAAVAAEGEDVVFYCTACRNGYRFHSEEPHLERIEVQFIAASNLAAERYLPFWVLDANVQIKNRQGGRDVSGLIQSLFGGSERRGLGGDIEFVVPAFQADLDSIVELARRYTRELPSLDERVGEKLTGGCYGIEDARKVARFAFLAAEVDKPDLLRSIDYAVRFGESRLLGVPFASDGRNWKDAVFGITVLQLVSK